MIDLPMNWTISCRRSAPSTLRSATSRARWLARAVARLVKLTTAMPRISIAMIAKVMIVRAVVAGRHRAVLRLAEVDVLDIDDVPILVVAGVELGLAAILVGDVALLPCGRPASIAFGVGARAQLHIDPAVLAAPAFEHLRRVGVAGGVIEPRDRVDLKCEFLGCPRARR